MGYYEFRISLPAESRDALIERLSEMGCLGITDNDSSIVAYFSDVLGIDHIMEGLMAFKPVLKRSGLDNAFSFEYLFISERDWNESWKKKFTPIDVGESLTILPPWEERNNGRTNLIIDPGMAFGTGHHETTKTCLTLIERLSGTGKKGRFLDIGTGSGVLAIAALKLGFDYALGIDIDPLAVDASLRNVASNDLKNVEIRKGTLSDVEETFDMIAANLLSEILISMAPEMKSRLTPSGIVLTSGMLTGQDRDVIAAMEQQGFRLLDTIHDGRWVSLLFGLVEPTPFSTDREAAQENCSGLMPVVGETGRCPAAPA